MQRIPGNAPTSSVQPPMPAGVPEVPPTALNAPAAHRMTQTRIIEAMGILKDYQKGKAVLEARVKANDKWWRMHHWEVLENGAPNANERKSAWLLNMALNKHADAMDNVPAAAMLPREASDEATAKILSSIVPVVLDQGGFEGVYSDHWWKKLKAGTGILGVFWNQSKLNGLGDVDIRCLDILNLFWQPGVRDIQQSRNLFSIEMHLNDALKEQYPQLANQNLGTQSFSRTKYDADDVIDDSKYSLVVDWYYKIVVNGKPILHYCKFVGSTVLYASEDDPKAQGGYYADGKYPFVFDVLFPIEDSPAGFGYIDVGKDAQERIDTLGAAITQNALMRGKKRFFIKTSGSVNEAEFCDWTRDLVHTEGPLGEDSIREIRVDPLGADVFTAYEGNVNELKETTGNRDFSTGGTTGSVTAASAIAALQEAGSKLSRDMIKGSYRAYKAMVEMVIDRIRQFYDLPRKFRIVGEAGAQQFVTMDNSGMMMQQQDPTTSRLPVFDIDVRAQKANPYSKAAQNEMALNFYRMGFFNPQMADQTLVALDMMDFDGKDKIVQRVAQNASLLRMLQAVLPMLDAIARTMPGAPMGNDAANILMQMGQMGMVMPQGGMPQAGGPTQTDTQGSAAPANRLAEKTRARVAGASDPNGGRA